MELQLEDGTLYYEVRGAGKPILLIHGVVVDAWLYENAADLLAPHAKVITFDRRGSSRSKMQPGAHYDMDAQIGDIKALLDALGIDRVTVCGASAGAVIGQYFMQCYPDRVERLVMYEPPLVSLMEDETMHAAVREVKDLIARRRLNTATLHFLDTIGAPDPRAPEKPPEVALREMENLSHFLKDEYAVFMDYVPDLDFCRAARSHITVALGDRSGDLPYARTARNFASLIDVQPVYFPGGHNLPWELPREFAISLLGTLLLTA